MVNLKCEAVLPECDMKPLEEIEKSITAEYKKSIWTKFLKAVNEFGLVKDGDKIAIAISGGKDSLLLYKLFQQLKKDKRRNFEFRAVNLNPGFKNEDLDNFKNNPIVIYYKALHNFNLILWMLFRQIRLCSYIFVNPTSF